MAGILQVMFGTFFSALHRGDDIVAVADVGSGSVGFAIVKTSAGGPARVVAAERSMLAIEARAYESTAGALARELERVGAKVLADLATREPALGTPSSVLCVIRAPWTTSESLREQQAYPEEVAITRELTGELARRSLARVSAFDRRELLGATVVQVELNGYATAHPAGKRAHEVSVVSLVSGCDPLMRRMVERALEVILPHKPHALRSGGHALFAVLRQYASEGTYAIAEVSGEGTGFIVVRDGAPQEQCLVREGVYSLLRRISKDSLPEETLAAVRSIESDRCTTEACTKVAAALAQTEPELVRIFGEGMAGCVAKRRLPDKLYLVAHPDMSSWFTTFFSRIDFTQFTRTAKPFTVQSITPNDMQEFVTAQNGVRLDPGIAIAAALVNIESRG